MESDDKFTDHFTSFSNILRCIFVIVKNMTFNNRAIKIFIKPIIVYEFFLLYLTLQWMDSRLYFAEISNSNKYVEIYLRQ